MGELINNYPNRSRLRENFVRESRGNYKYGDKKIQVLSEGAKLSSKLYFNKISQILKQSAFIR